MEFELSSYERAAEAAKPWPAPCPMPPLPVPDDRDLAYLRNGEIETDRMEAAAAAAARCRGALDLAVGDGLAAMQRGERLIRLGYSNLGDYAREVLGIGERTAQDLGVATGLLSVPCRYMHSPNEMVALEDLDRAAALLAAWVRRLKPGTSFIPE